MGGFLCVGSRAGCQSLGSSAAGLAKHLLSPLSSYRLRQRG